MHKPITPEKSLTYLISYATYAKSAIFRIILKKETMVDRIIAISQFAVSCVSLLLCKFTAYRIPVK